MAEYLADELPVYLPDCPGFGLSKYAVDDKPEQLLPQIQCPTLIVRGEQDPIGSQQWHEGVERRLPRGRLLVLDDLAHTINVTAPQRLANIVRQFALEPEQAIEKSLATP